MRVKLTFLASKRNATLPLSYNHAVAGLIYRTIGNASEEYAAALHDEGFEADRRRFKLFTFSRLFARRNRVVGDRMILESPEVSLQVSSPVGDFIEHFVSGLFQSERFNIAGSDFTLAEAETIAPPEFSERMSFRALAPITESVRDEQNRVRYLNLEDDWSAIIKRNLARKYQALYGRAPVCDRLHWEWDLGYIAEARKRNRRPSVLIEVSDGIKVRGWLAPFTVHGSKELIEIGYEAGFGKSNAMGFGLAEASV
ncbi:MAG TPA: CRISPR-associated endoribonuclease Cas6 [Blastocatellia bacterium]|nr:CRISPR-associated endoribonuclease Cas6 [Blastocatellia bacterium]